MRHSRLLTTLLVSLLAAGCGEEGGGGTPDPGSPDAGAPDSGSPTYSIGGGVVGLAGSGLALRLNDGAPLAVTADGPFTFPDALPTGTSYAVTVVTQPTSPTQDCTVSGGTGTVGTANVANVQVACITPAPLTFTVGGTVADLEGTGLKLTRDGTEELAVEAGATTFAFPTPLDDGTPYTVVVSQQPAGATCSVSGGTGSIASANVTTVSVECLPNALVLRLGDGALEPAAGTGVAVTLHEYGPAPATVLRSHTPEATVSLSAGTTYEGALSRSTDGRLVSFAAYEAPPGTAAVASSTVGAPRAAVTVDATGVARLAVEIPEATAFTNRQVRSAVTVDGTAFWLSGDGAIPPVPPETTSTTNGGVWYATTAPGSTPLRISGVPNAARWLGIFRGQLFLSAAPRPVPVPGGEPVASEYVGISTVGTGLPTTEGVSCTRVAGTDNGSPPVEIATEPHGFAFLDARASPALDTLYVANDSEPAAGSVHVQKYVFRPSSKQWEHVATFVPKLTDASLPPMPALGLAARRLADGTSLVYATTADDHLVVFRDDGTDTPAVTVLATAPAGTHFRGVALAPVTK